jgi:hypothetical protein
MSPLPLHREIDLPIFVGSGVSRAVLYSESMRLYRLQNNFYFVIPRRAEESLLYGV